MNSRLKEVIVVRRRCCKRVWTACVPREEHWERAYGFAGVVGASKAKSVGRQTAGVWQPSPWQQRAAASAACAADIIISVIVVATQTVIVVQVSETRPTASQRQRVRATSRRAAAAAAGWLDSQVCRHADVNQLTLYYYTSAPSAPGEPYSTACSVSRPEVVRGKLATKPGFSFLWPPSGQAIIFGRCGFFLSSSFFFFSSPILSSCRLQMSTVLPHVKCGSMVDMH